MMDHELNRREFVVALSAFFGALSFAPEILWAQGENALALPAAIGQKYIQIFGQESVLGDLKSKIQGSVNSILSQKTVLDTVRLDIADDYLSSRTFEFENWLLSKTEGRLCALAYLEAQPRRR